MQQKALQASTNRVLHMARCNCQETQGFYGRSQNTVAISLFLKNMIHIFEEFNYSSSDRIKFWNWLCYQCVVCKAWCKCSSFREKSRRTSKYCWTVCCKWSIRANGEIFEGDVVQCDNSWTCSQKSYRTKIMFEHLLEGVAVQWRNPLTLKLGQSGRQCLIPSRAPPIEHHDKGLWTRLGLLYFYFCDPSALR